MNPTQHEALQAVAPGATAKSEGGHDYVYLPGLQVEVGGVVRVLDALLGITPIGGYVTRLYLAEPILERTSINGQAANWTTHMVLGRPWHTWSWRDVPPTLPLIQILLAHLRALA